MANEVRLIDANALKIDAEQSFHDWPVVRGDIARMITRQSTIDPERLRPVGRWKGEGLGDHSCSLCCEIVSGNEYNYCPNCGAKMEG